MPDLNPYNCAKPHNLFVGYDRVLDRIRNGFCNEHSFAILGGRRCGKTSLLLEIERQLTEAGLAGYRVMPRFLDMQELGEVTPSSLFARTYYRRNWRT